MLRALFLVVLAIACDCGSSDNAATNVASTTEEDAASLQRVGAFDFDAATGIISLDTRISLCQNRRFDIGQGSITLETLGINDSKLRFQYTPEIEGGYTIYECTVPVSKSPVTIKVNRDGTPGETSFDLTKCRVVKTGNVHWE